MPFREMERPLGEPTPTRLPRPHQTQSSSNREVDAFHQEAGFINKSPPYATLIRTALCLPLPREHSSALISLDRRLTGRVTQSLRGVKSGSLGRGEAGLLEFGSFICTPEWRLINASPGCGKTLARIFGFFPPHCIIQQAKVFNISQTAAGRHKICFYCEALPGSGLTRNLLFFSFQFVYKEHKNKSTRFCWMRKATLRSLLFHFRLFLPSVKNTATTFY